MRKCILYVVVSDKKECGMIHSFDRCIEFIWFYCMCLLCSAILLHLMLLGILLQLTCIQSQLLHVMWMQSNMSTSINHTSYKIKALILCSKFSFTFITTIVTCSQSKCIKLRLWAYRHNDMWLKQVNLRNKHISCLVLVTKTAACVYPKHWVVCGAQLGDSCCALHKGSSSACKSKL